MSEWTCETCGWILEVPSEQEVPTACPLCSAEHQPAAPRLQRHRWMAGDEARAALAAGRRLCGVYIERINLDGETFEHAVEIIDSIVGEWSGREAMFAKGLDVARSQFLGHFEAGAGQSERLGRFARGAHFGGPLSLVGTRFYEGAQLNGCRMMGGLSAAGVQVWGQINLSGVEVHGDADLSESKLDLLTVRGAQFGGRLLLERTVVAREVIIAGILACGATLAREAEFYGEFYLGESRFNKEANLAGSVFRGQATFDATEFQREFELDSAHFQAPVEFCQTEFDGWADFEWARFDGPVVFKEVDFQRGADFQNSICSGPFTLRGVHFHGEVYFRHARFSRQFDVVQSGFEERVDLRDMDVAADLHIERVEFARDAYLSRSHFTGRVSWEQVTVNGLLKGPEIVVERDLTWSDCRFQDDLVLAGGRLGKAFDLPGCELAGSLDLRRTKFEGPADLTSARLAGRIHLEGISADNFRIELDQVKHHLASELAGDWAIAAKEWEFLRKAFERRNLSHDVDSAFFKTRQMKNRAGRVGMQKVWRILEMIFTEWGTGYGTRPGNIFAISLLTILFFAAIYMILSFPAISEGAPDTLASFRDYVYFSISTFTALGAGSEMVVAVEAFVGGFLMALFASLLARRVFRQ
jgi:uncharacterized protein YjbI with pentapeptide repeats